MHLGGSNSSGLRKGPLVCGRVGLQSPGRDLRRVLCDSYVRMHVYAPTHNLIYCLCFYSARTHTHTQRASMQHRSIAVWPESKTLHFKPKLKTWTAFLRVPTLIHEPRKDSASLQEADTTQTTTYYFTLVASNKYCAPRFENRSEVPDCEMQV